jgi:hypothetical protein
MRSRLLLASVVAMMVTVVAAAENPGLAVATTQQNAEELPAVNVSHMLRGYFFAASPIRDPKALGGFGGSDNLPASLDRDVPPNAVSLIALPEELVPFDRSQRGFRVILANTTERRVAFAASDSRLRIVREALSPEGEWKAIEYLPSSWCGNSYHEVFLPPGHSWSFSAPVYAGAIETRMRFVLRGSSEGEAIYSNEFPGAVNKEQFSIRQGHTPTSLMDPYND